MRSDVSFPGHDGTTLRGWLFLPDSAGSQLPGVVMTHGFSATKEMALDRFADLFSEGGIAVLVYDHRCLGASDGEPRQLIDPWAQMRDYVAAIDWLSTQDRVDAGRIGLWGTSFSGGEALIVGAVDRRVRAVVANVPFVGSPRSQSVSEQSVHELAVRLRQGSQLDKEVPLGPMSVVTEAGVDGAAVMPQSEASEWFLDEGRRPGSGWENLVFLPDGTGVVDFDPSKVLAGLSVPTLLVLASDDRVAPTADGLTAFDLLPEPKDLLVIDGHHFTPYSGGALTRAATAALQFYLDWL
jgi:fermentation-respiration switch protein FrsA (DUF1100 family)